MSRHNRDEALALDARAQQAPSLSEAQALMHRADRLRRGGTLTNAPPLPVLRN